jgi:hypothetical protein
LHSEALEKALGYDPEELKETPIHQLFSSAVDDQFLIKLARARRTGELYWPNAHMALKSGAVHQMDIRADVQPDAGQDYALVF